MMRLFIHARLQPGKDNDLIEWLAAQSEGARSEAIRALLRDGMRMRQLEAHLTIVVRQAVAEALAGQQLVTNKAEVTHHEVEDLEGKFGAKLDKMMGEFTANLDSDDAES
jgi:hypothetical protein